MRILADENFPKSAVDMLRDTGNDVLWARTDCPGWKDSALLELAEAEARIIVSLDKDFWQVAIQRRGPLRQSGVVLFRAHPATEDNFEPVVSAFLKAGRPWAGHISIFTVDAIQMLAAGRK